MSSPVYEYVLRNHNSGKIIDVVDTLDDDNMPKNCTIGKRIKFCAENAEYYSDFIFWADGRITERKDRR